MYLWEKENFNECRTSTIEINVGGGLGIWVVVMVGCGGDGFTGILF